MTPGEFSAIVCATSYKPRSRIRFKKLAPDPNPMFRRNSYMLVASLWVQDVDDPDKEIVISMSATYTEDKIEGLSERDVLKIIQTLWRKLELHEVDEYFKYRGVNFESPHEGIIDYDHAKKRIARA